MIVWRVMVKLVWRLASETFYEDFTVKLSWGLSCDSMESDNFYGDIMVKLVWRLSGNLIYGKVLPLRNSPY